MCGLAGIFSYSENAQPASRDELLRIRDHMERRGPDGSGIWTSQDKRTILGHRRLAIIDLSERGAQPMATEDGRYRIVFNGEIYNYKELRSDLVKQGARFFSDSDTEVLLHLYARDGAAMLPRLRGMFTLAIWDDVEQHLFLARDPFGIKPLYIADDGRSLRFASQVKALIAGGAVSSEIDEEAQVDYWIWGAVQEPRTIYKDIAAFAPGSWLKVQRGGKRESGNFESVGDFLNRPGSTAPGIGSSLHDVLLDSVRHHLVADVPVGIFLSGGIDSALMAALATESGYRPRTLTMGFEEFRGTAADETVQAAETAKALGTQHETHWISRREFEEAFDSFMQSMDQPSIDGLNTWLVSRAAAQAGLKVVISGLGGDEFFGGYPSFSQVPLMRRLAKPFSFLPFLGVGSRKLLAPLLRNVTSEKFAGLLEYGATWEGAYMLRRALRMPWQVDAKVNHGFVDREHWSDSHRAVSHLEASRYMRNQLLRDSDWASMAHSIELRVPLVDKEVTQYVGRERAAGRPCSKQALGLASCIQLPESVTHAPKRGFVLPLREWLMARDPAKTHRGLLDWSTFMHDQFFLRSVPAV